MKKLFTAIRHEDIDTVKQLLEQKPELVNCVAKQPPKKEDGQSPLQVALKTGAFDIAELLIDLGADLNFIEDEATCCNEWRTPVIQDGVVAAVMSSRWNTVSPFDPDENGNAIIKVFSTREKAERAYHLLKRMLEMGANINAVDSYGRNGLWRFCIQAEQILPRYNYAEDCEYKDRLFTKELEEDLKRILELLKDAGVNHNQVMRDTGESPMVFYKKGSMRKLLDDVFN